ncbi:hypothetical protein D3C79_817150 [compost metagenome]
MLLLAVVPVVPLSRTMVVPSTTSSSSLPLPRLPTVRINWSIFCPASSALTVTPLNRSAAPPPSVKVGLFGVATTVGASLIAVMATVTLALLLVPPSPSLTVTRTVRLALAMSPVLLLL